MLRRCQIIKATDTLLIMKHGSSIQVVHTCIFDQFIVIKYFINYDTLLSNRLYFLPLIGTSQSYKSVFAKTVTLRNRPLTCFNLVYLWSTDLIKCPTSIIRRRIELGIWLEVAQYRKYRHLSDASLLRPRAEYICDGSESAECVSLNKWLLLYSRALRVRFLW